MKLCIIQILGGHFEYGNWQNTNSLLLYIQVKKVIKFKFIKYKVSNLSSNAYTRPNENVYNVHTIAIQELYNFLSIIG